MSQRAAQRFWLRSSCINVSESRARYVLVDQNRQTPRRCNFSTVRWTVDWIRSSSAPPPGFRRQILKLHWLLLRSPPYPPLAPWTTSERFVKKCCWRTPISTPSAARNSKGELPLRPALTLAQNGAGWRKNHCDSWPDTRFSARARLAGTSPRGGEKDLSPPHSSGLSRTDREPMLPNLERVEVAQFPQGLPRRQCTVLPVHNVQHSFNSGTLHPAKTRHKSYPQQEIRFALSYFQS
jgi:hypothetical protein